MQDVQQNKRQKANYFSAVASWSETHRNLWSCLLNFIYLYFAVVCPRINFIIQWQNNSRSKLKAQ